MEQRLVNVMQAAIGVDVGARKVRGQQSATDFGHCLPQGVDIIAPAFASNIGVENEPAQYNGGEVWFDVLGITPSRRA